MSEESVQVVDTGDVAEVPAEEQLEQDDALNTERGGLGDSGAEDVSGVEEGEVVEVDSLPAEDGAAEDETQA